MTSPLSDALHFALNAFAGDVSNAQLVALRREARMTERNVRRCVYTTCDYRAAQALAQYARGMGLGTVVHADSMAENATYTITIS